MNENKAIALEILKLHSERFEIENHKTMAEKYNEILISLENKDCRDIFEQNEGVAEIVLLPKGFILRFEFGTFRVMEDVKIQVVAEKVVTGGVYGVSGTVNSGIKD